MKEYFVSKLTDIIRKIEATKNSLVKYAGELDIRNITSCVDSLKQLTEKQKELTIDAVKYLSVDDVIAMMKFDMINMYAASYEYKYSKFVTLEERDRLVKVSYEFKEARIK